MHTFKVGDRVQARMSRIDRDPRLKLNAVYTVEDCDEYEPWVYLDEAQDWFCADQLESLDNRPATVQPLDQHAPGTKLDVGKDGYDLVLEYFSGALAAVNAVAEFGAKKYSRGGWRTVPEGNKRYTNALVRHLVKRQGGEVSDPESDMDHYAHAAWNALAILQLKINEKNNASK